MIIRGRQFSRSDIDLIKRTITDNPTLKFYNYRPLLIEIFVEKQRFSGASYKAANWIYLGQTRGKGRSGLKYYCHGIIKDIYVYPLINISLLRKILKQSEEMMP